MDETMQVVRGARHILHAMVPCDILAFLEVWPEVKANLAVTIVVALIKEPTVIHRWSQTEFWRTALAPPQGQGTASTATTLAEGMAHSLTEVATWVGRAPNMVELDQLVGSGCIRGVSRQQMRPMMMSGERSMSDVGFAVRYSSTRRVLPATPRLSKVRLASPGSRRSCGRWA